MPNIESNLPITVCIPTKDRPHELERCINSILNQSILPKEILVIDDGNLEVQKYKNQVTKFAEFKYHKKDKPSLSASKNKAKELASYDLILILDDDIVLEKNYINNIYKIFLNDTEKNIGAIGGVENKDMKHNKLKKIYKNFFLINSQMPGQLSEWGFETGFVGIQKNTFVEWARGGASCFRKEFLNEYKFEDFFGGRNALEDVELGYQIKKRQKWKMIITPASKFDHFHSPTGRESIYYASFKETYNRCWIFKKHANKNLKNIFFFLWTMLGRILLTVLSGKYKKLQGNIAGILTFIFYKRHNWSVK